MSSELEIEEVQDRLVLRLEAGGPVELTGLTDSFAALARYYERHFGGGPEADLPRLFITRISTGSIIAEIAPFALLLGQTYPYIEAAVVVSDFASRLIKGLRAFAGLGPIEGAPPSESDAHDLREFVKPLTGNSGASLGIKHARFVRRDADSETVAEYVFVEAELNRAAANIDNLFGPETLLAHPSKVSKPVKEVMLFFHSASRAPGKEQGRATDRAV